MGDNRGSLLTSSSSLCTTRSLSGTTTVFLGTDGTTASRNLYYLVVLEYTAYMKFNLLKGSRARFLLRQLERSLSTIKMRHGVKFGELLDGRSFIGTLCI